jgi:CIC family chloride channel protein
MEAITHAAWYLRLLLPALGGLLAGLVARKGPGAGQSFGDVMEAAVLGRVHLSLRATARKALGSWFAIAGGGSIGREGPLIQFGGALGYFVSDRIKVTDAQKRVLVAAGIAAGFTAAYNTPLAAILFVVEVVTGIVAVDSMIYVLIATTISTAIARGVVGGGPIYGERAFAIESNWELLAHAALGLAAGLTVYGFQRLLAAGEWLASREWLPQPWRAALGGLGVGAMAIVLPQVAGNGYEPLNRLLDGEYPLALIAILLIAKAVATTSSVASGSPGGVFTPSLFLGGALGAVWGAACAHLFHLPVAHGSYALVGMAAATAAMTHAPLMASLLVFEISGDYAIVLPLALATAGSTWVARALKADSVYAAELKRRGVAWTLKAEVTRD